MWAGSKEEKPLMRLSARWPALGAALAVAATTLVATTPASANSFTPDYLSPYAVGDTVYFIGRTAKQGRELWATDGTTGGTRLVKDINPGTASAFSSQNSVANSASFTALGDQTLFIASDKSGRGVFATDGTKAGTVRVSPPGLKPGRLVAFGGELYFVGNDKTADQELWKTDGTTAGTVLVADIRPGKYSSEPTNLTVVGDRLFFVADSGPTYSARSIYTVDASDEVVQGPTVSASRDLQSAVAFEDKLIYRDLNTLMESDGTIAGTRVLVSKGAVDTLTVFDQQVYWAQNYQNVKRVMRLGPDGPEALSEERSLGIRVFGDRLWFTTADDSTHRGTLWTVAGADGEPVALTSFAFGQEVAWKFWPAYANGLLYFEARGKLWSSDGTTGGTQLIRDLKLKNRNATYVEIAATNSTIVVAALDRAAFDSLWISNGTPAGTYRRFPEAAFTKAPVPVIVGTPAAGETLSVAPGAWSPVPDALTYKWKINNVAVAGATAATFTVPSVAAGSKITVSVIATRAGFTTLAKTSAPKVVVEQFVDAPTPTLSGTLAAGEVLTADAGTWSPSATLSYAWFADGKAIYKGPKTNKYTVTATSQFKSITVTVTAKKSGYLTTSRTSLPAGTTAD